MNGQRLAFSVLFILLWPACGLRAAAPVRSTGAGAAPPTDRTRTPARKAVVTLRDGTRLVGRISSMQNGLISLETEQLGTVTVPAAAVESVIFSSTAIDRRRSGSAVGVGSRGGNPVPRPGRTAGQAAAPTLSATAAAPDLQGLMQAISGDPDIMRSISALQQDPDIQAVIRDPAIQRAVQSGNLLQLMKDPKIIKLLENRKIQDVSRRIVNGRKRLDRR